MLGMTMRAKRVMQAKLSRIQVNMYHGTGFNAYDRLLHLLKTAPSARAQYAATPDALASFYLSYGRVGDAESVGKQALTVRQKLGNLSDIAVSQV
jgi:hypothetical protein